MSTDSSDIGQSSMDIDQTNIGISPQYQNDKHENEVLRQTITPPFTRVENHPHGESEFNTFDGYTPSASSMHKYKLPPRQVADKLFNDYFNEIHPEFPIINKPLFRTQYVNFWEHAQRPGDKWLAILNMMFAITSLHTYRTKLRWDCDDDHHLYFNRAKVLSMTESEFFAHPDLQQVQIEGLCAFYLLASDQFDMAWRIAALMTRSAVALGSNLKNTQNANVFSREARCRLWWCVYAFEQVLGLIACRPTSMFYDQDSMPVPLLPQDEDRMSSELNPESLESARPSSNNIEANTDLFFVFACKLAVIVEEIGNKVYNLTTWSERERVASDLKCRFESWLDGLPSYLNFTQMNSFSQQFYLKATLACHYHSSRIALGRPWLFQNASDRNTSYTMARMALDSANQIIRLLPEEPDMSRLYQMFPWWCALHYITQAAKVLFSELSLGCVHIPDEKMNVIQLAKKCIRYFEVMAHRSSRARQAWLHFRSLYRNLSFRLGYSTDDIPSLANTVTPSPLYINYGDLAFNEINDIDLFDFHGDIGKSV